ncbi:acetylserotonin O-methyltransferase [Streptomyces halobius]|uniref:Acetylserotonin O-methyltransferase n=2 Tax=Streptomyces halobius TaxID=2879846 RepID=A0ABY4MK28_9ACTN|nr:acetylserotonin O-methyltransferase [Streptomyces halobius]UQA98108.1 acetylserotonin O-methyltransferase [Streptomyces halobius]
MVMGAMAAQTVGAAARLGIVDLIGGGERTADELAAECAAQPQAMGRLLRALTGLGLLVEGASGGFAVTPVGDLLRGDAPRSLRSFARSFTDPAMLRAWERLDDSVRTGETSFDAVFGKDFFGYLAEHPELSAEFNAAMSEATRETAELVPAAFDFGSYATVADIGGGDGTLLAAILTAHPELYGIVFDTAEGLAQAGTKLARAGLDGRSSLVTGDFFAAAPEGADLYLLKSVIHDWNDEQCVGILRHCRRAIPDGGRLLIVEPVLPPAVNPSVAGVCLSDLNMLVNVGGRERTRDDFERLCHDAGFEVRTVTPLPKPNRFSVIEAAPV